MPARAGAWRAGTSKLPSFEAGRPAGHTPGHQRSASTPPPTSSPGSSPGRADLTGNTGVKLDGGVAPVRRAPRGHPDPLRDPRARHGVGDDRHGRPRRGPPGGRHLLHLQRLHAPGRPPRRPVAKPTSSTRGPTTRSGLGEDGPTHQPVEQLASMRAMPGLRVIRPADANETAHAWRIAVDSDGPTALSCRARALPVLDGTAEAGRRRGPGRLCPRRAGGGTPDVVLSAPAVGGPALRRGRPTLLAGAADRPLAARVVSLPSWDLFAAQGDATGRAVLPPGVPRAGRRGGRLLRVGALRRRRRRHRPLRRLGPGRRGPRPFRVHPRQRGGRPGPAGPVAVDG